MRVRLALPILCSILPLACSRPLPDAPEPRHSPPPTLTPTRISRPTSAAEKARALATSVDLVAADRCGEAIPLLRVLLDAYSEMEDYHLHHLATCLATSGDTAGASSAWSHLVTEHPRSIHAPAAALEWGRTLRAEGDLGAAEPLLRRASAAEDSEIANLARLELAEIAIARGDIRTAYTALSALREQASGDVAQRARTSIASLRRQYPELAPRSIDERQRELDLLLREGEHVEALRVVNGLLATAATADRPRLLRKRAGAELAAGDTERHLRTLREVHESYPQSPEAPGALFQEARWLWNKDRDGEARSAFLEFERRYPRSGQMVTVRYAIGRIAQAAGDRTTALSRFGSVVERHPGTTLAAESRWQLAWIRYYDRQWNEAAQQFSQLARGKSTAQAADAIYWRGRALESAGSTGAAREIYGSILERATDTYYAGLASERLGHPASPRAAELTPPRLMFPALPPHLRDDYHLFRAGELHRARLMNLARREVRSYARDNSDPDRDLMIDLYRAVDGHRQAIRLAVGRGAGYGHVLYPFAFWDLIEPQAERYRIDPLLVLSLMRQESLFDTEALSPANARGLMQLLPSTAAAVAARIGRSGRIDLCDPATNIELGVAHLRELADLYDGDRVRILAAYNAGATAVERWDRRFADRPTDEYVESITFRETRDYVKKVLGNYRTYARMNMARQASERTIRRTDREHLGRIAMMDGGTSP